MGVTNDPLGQDGSADSVIVGKRSTATFDEDLIVLSVHVWHARPLLERADVIVVEPLRRYAEPGVEW